jgi:hypothetical protein
MRSDLRDMPVDIRLFRHYFFNIFIIPISIHTLDTIFVVPNLQI